MRNLSADQRWCLSWWSTCGWSIGRPGDRGAKKWEAHIAALEKAGLLEPDEYGMHRLTLRGRAALEALDE